MLAHTNLTAGLLLAGDGLAQKMKAAYPVQDLLVPDHGLRQNAKSAYPVEDLLVPDPPTDTDRNIRSLFQQIEKDHIPYPESDLALPAGPPPVDPVLGDYPPSKRLIERVSPKR